MTSSFLALSQGKKGATLSNDQLAPDLGASDLYACSGMDKATCPAQSALLCFLDPGGDCIPQASSWQATWPPLANGWWATVQLPPHVLGRKDLTWTLTLSPFLGWHHQGQGHLRGCVLGMAKQLATGLAKHLGGRATYPSPAFALVFHRTEKQTFFF